MLLLYIDGGGGQLDLLDIAEETSGNWPWRYNFLFSSTAKLNNLNRMASFSGTNL